jgi:hypothetical protein
MVLIIRKKNPRDFLRTGDFSLTIKFYLKDNPSPVVNTLYWALV